MEDINIKNINIALNSYQKQMGTMLEWLEGFKMNQQQAQLIEQIQTQVCKQSKTLIEPDKIEYPEELKQACKKLEEKEEKAYQRKLKDESIHTKMEDNNPNLKGDIKQGKHVQVTNESSTDSDFGGSSDSDNGYEEYYTTFSSKLQQHFLQKKNNNKFSKDFMDNPLEEHKVVDVVNQDFKQLIILSVPHVHTQERQIDLLFSSFASKFLDELNRRSFGTPYAVFNRCVVTAQPNFLVYSPINIHFLTTQTESVHARKHLTMHSSHYLLFLKRCFETKGSSLVIIVSYINKTFVNLTLKYRLHKYKENFYFEKIDFNSQHLFFIIQTAYTSCPQYIDDIYLLEEFLRILEIPFNANNQKHEQNENYQMRKIGNKRNQIITSFVINCQQCEFFAINFVKCFIQTEILNFVNFNKDTLMKLQF